MARNLVPWTRRNGVAGPFEELRQGLERWTPRIDVEDTPKEVIVSASLPGMDKNDIRVEVRGDVLTLQGERRAQSKQEKGGYRRIEQSYGSFYRSLTLPARVMAEAVRATYKDGVLRIRLPKAEERRSRDVRID